MNLKCCNCSKIIDVKDPKAESWPKVKVVRKRVCGGQEMELTDHHYFCSEKCKKEFGA